MPISLPSNPSDGQTYTFDSKTWSYSAAAGVWKKIRAAAPDLSGGTVSLDANNWGTLQGGTLQQVLDSIDTAIGTINTDISNGVTVQAAVPSMLYKAVDASVVVDNAFLNDLGLTTIPQMHMLTLRLANSSGSGWSVSYDSSISDIGSTAAPTSVANDSSHDFLLWTYDGGSSWNMMYILLSDLNTGATTAISVEPTTVAPYLVYSQIQHYSGQSGASTSDVIDFDSVHFLNQSGVLQQGDLLLVVYQGTGAYLNTDRVTAPAGWTQLFGFAEDAIISAEEPPGPGDDGGSSDDEDDYSVQMIAYYRVVGANDPGNLGTHTWSTDNGTGSRLLSLAVVRGADTTSIPTYTTNVESFSTFKGNTTNNDIWNGDGDSGAGAASNSPTATTATLSADSVSYSANSLVLGYFGYFNKGNSATQPQMQPKVDMTDFLSTPAGMISHGIEGTPGAESGNSLRHVQKLVSQTYSGLAGGSTGAKTSSTKEPADTYNNGFSALIVIPS